MIYATIYYKGKEQICCIDKVGARVFLIENFLKEELKIEKTSISMLEFIKMYEPIWTDKLALFFGIRGEYAVSLNDVKLLAPIPRPERNIVCLGKNYQAHIEEIKGKSISDAPPSYPIYFTKPDHTVVGTGDTILLHKNASSMIDYEVEFALIIGKKGINIPKERAEEFIFGYTIANDVSARDLQRNHSQWYRGKSLVTHCPMGPWIVHKSALSLPLELSLTCKINDELRQQGNIKDMIFDIPTIISDLSKGYELRPGDIILTGTPSGVGMGFNPPKYLNAGDRVVCEIEQIGILENTVGD
jgi:2-keto-4-pentenoate hydratase/2-oxohepta-3-ene-1,7-dioic acid hydratase in catechol pathway